MDWKEGDICWEQERTKKEVYPWRRFFARSFDLSVYGILWHSMKVLLLHWSGTLNFWMTIRDSYIIFLLMIFLEPLFLSVMGSTPGKKIWGISLKREDGKRLSYKEGLRRTFLVFWKGYGLGIPIYVWIRLYRCRNASKDGKLLYWEEEEDGVLALQDKKGIRVLGYVVLTIILYGLAFLVGLQGQMPKNRGELTAVTYQQNVNQIISETNMRDWLGFNEQGQWVPKEDMGRVVLVISEGTFPNHQIQKDANKNVISVSFEREENTEFVYGRNYSLQKAIITRAFLAAQKESNLFLLWDSEIKEMIKRVDSFQIEKNGILIQQEVSYKGYEKDRENFMKEEENGIFSIYFSMEKIEN